MQTTGGRVDRPTPRRAIVRRPSPRLAEGEVTHIDREPLDLAAAFAQHAAYCDVLEALGLELVWAPDAPEHPDGLFVEDALLVIAGRAVLTRPGAASRAGEVASIATVLPQLALPHAEINATGTLDGGDVLAVGSEVFVGLSTRSNPEAVEQLAAILTPLGLTVRAATVSGCLHLKSAVTALPDGSLIAVPDRVDTAWFEHLGYRVHAAAEPSGGDVLCIGETVVLPASAVGTAAYLATLGFPVVPIDVGELEKIEAGVTCMSVLC